MKQAIAKDVSENPFYNCRALLDLQRQLERMTDQNVSQSTLVNLLNKAWSEVSTKEQRQLFFILMFSAGDIENRQHNMFKRKVDQGGHSKRKIFRMMLAWCLNTSAATQYFYQLLPVIAEYTNYENLFYNQLRTDPKTKVVTSAEVLNIDKAKVVSYLIKQMKEGTDFDRTLIAKFLPKIPKTKRWRKTKEGKSYAQPKRPATLKKDSWNVDLINETKKQAGWSSKEYSAWRSQYLANTEAHLFSSKKITEFDVVEFGNWLETLPAGARYRVQRRLLDKEKATFYGASEKLVSTNKWKLKGGVDMGGEYLKWTANKEAAMKKLVSLTEEDKKNMNTVELKALTKAAKITTGGTTLFDTFVEAFGARGSELSVKMQTLVDKIKIDVPVLTIVDNSGSMGNRVTVGNTTTTSLDIAKFCAAVMLYKSPSADMKRFMMTFNSNATVYHDESYVEVMSGKNRFIQSVTNKKVPSLVVEGQPFIETLKVINSLFTTTGYTDLTTVSRALKAWTEEDQNTKAMKIEAIRAYSVVLVISDGDLNSHGSGSKSMQAFQSDMMHYFGAAPVVVLWDVIQSPRQTTEFEGLDNFIHVAGVNAAIINQVFLNINDLDIIDIFISLKTAFESSRYEPIKQLVN